MFDGLLQPTHLLLILAIVLIIFGPGKLAGVGRALGQSVHEFRESTADRSTTPAPQPVPADDTTGDKGTPTA